MPRTIACVTARRLGRAKQLTRPPAISVFAVPGGPRLAAPLSLRCRRSAIAGPGQFLCPRDRLGNFRMVYDVPLTGVPFGGWYRKAK